MLSDSSIAAGASSLFVGGEGHIRTRRMAKLPTVACRPLAAVRRGRLRGRLSTDSSQLPGGLN